MMKYVICCLFVLSVCATAQDTTKPAPPKHGWRNELVAGLSLTQVAFTDWVQGGENALGYTFNADGKSVDDEETSNWTTRYKFAFGQTRLGDQGLRKSDDLIDLSTVYTYKLGVYINPYISAALNTQFAKGFTYDAAGNGTEISKFFDPAYLTQSIGVGYQHIKEVKTRLGAGLREIITNRFIQYSDSEKTSVDGGLESVTNVEWNLDDNILFTTQLELFSPFKTMDKIVVRDMTNITAKVSKYVATIFTLQLINEPRITPQTQVKESIAIGLSYTMF